MSDLKKRVIYPLDYINKYSQIITLPQNFIDYIKRTSTLQIEQDHVPLNLKKVLNQLSGDNLYLKIAEIIVNISTIKHFQKFSELIFSMVILGDKFSGLYAKLCKILSHFTLMEDKTEITFTYVLLQNFSLYFDKCLINIEKISLTSEEDDVEWFNKKTFIKFVSELHNYNILNRYNIMVGVQNLYDPKIPNKIALLCRLVQSLSPIKIKKNKALIDIINELLHSDLKIYPPLIAFAIKDLEKKLKFD